MKRGVVKKKDGRPATTVDAINEALIGWSLPGFPDIQLWPTEADLIETTGLTAGQVNSALYRMRRDDQIQYRGPLLKDGTRGCKPLEYSILEEAV